MYDPRLIFDVGAHKGENASFYLALGYKVVSLEANPSLQVELHNKFSNEIVTGQLTIVNKAIAKESGFVSFFVNGNTIWGSKDKAWVERNQKTGFMSRQISVEAIPFDRLLAKCGRPYDVKIDIEGADILWLEAMIATIACPKYISIASEKTSWRLLLKEFVSLERINYTKFAIVDRRKQGKRSFTSIDGAVVEHDFTKRSPGPFGAFLVASKWATRRLTLLRYFFIFVGYKLLGDNTVLRRVLKRFPHRKKILRVVIRYDTHATF